MARNIEILGDCKENIHHPDDLIRANAILVQCAEIWDERMNNPSLQLEYGFGITQLGRFTEFLGEKTKQEIIKFNYQIEKNNEVGFCPAYNLVITPRKLYYNIFSNIYDDQTKKYLSDILKANEIKRTKKVYINLQYVYPLANVKGELISTWENETIKKISLVNLTKEIQNQTIGKNWEIKILE